MNSNPGTLVNDSKPVKKNNKKKIQELDSARINDFDNHLKVNTKDNDENTSMASASKGSKKSAKTGSKNNFENNEIKLELKLIVKGSLEDEQAESVTFLRVS